VQLIKDKISTKSVLKQRSVLQVARKRQLKKLKHSKDNQDSNVRKHLNKQVMTIISQMSPDNNIHEIFSAIDALPINSKKKGVRLCENLPRLNLNMGQYTDSLNIYYKEYTNELMQQKIRLAYGLYLRGFYELAFKISHDVFELSTKSKNAKKPQSKPFCYLPHAYNIDGCLSGTSEWIMLALSSKMLGVKEINGDLIIDPKLHNSQFDSKGEATIELKLQGKRVCVTYINKPIHKIKNYRIGVITINDQIITSTQENLSKKVIKREVIENEKEPIMIRVYLQKK